MKGRPQHGMSETPTYKSWCGMRDRIRGTTRNKRWVDLPNHDPRWEAFEEFYADMGDRPEGCTLDRINNEEGYNKENCRWATRQQQQRNLSNNRPLTYKGKTQLACDWAEELGINLKTLQTRLHRGWSDEEALGRVVQLK